MESFSFSLPSSLVSIFLCFLLTCRTVHGDPQVPCYFIFGDALSDNGNNNNRLTIEKTNYPPYGIDYPQGPTGRDSNGKVLPDVIAELLGFPNPILPFANATGNVILSGVNYASNGAGILNITSYQYGSEIPLGTQIQNHQTTISQITTILGGNRTAVSNLLNKCIYSIDIGSDDYIANYFAPEFYTTSRQYTPQQFTTLLLQKYSEYLKTLYGIGARKFALISLVSYTGCVPYEKAKNGITNGSCVEEVNYAVRIFNDGLLALVKELNNNMTNAKFSYVNAFAFGTSGFITNSTCCTTLGGISPLCVPYSVPCSNRSDYFYWDGARPTEAAYTLAGKEAYGSTNRSNVYPFNVRELALQ